MVVGLLASIQLRVVTQDLAGAGALISTVVTAGGDAARLHEVSFRHRDPVGLLRSNVILLSFTESYDIPDSADQVTSAAKPNSEIIACREPTVPHAG